MISKYYGAVTIQDRFHFLFTLGAVIRSESIFKADLSDLVDFAFNQEKEPDPYHVLVMRIGFGKIVRDDNSIYVRGLRHKDARLCHIGTLGLWLMTRFHVYNEMEGINFIDNKSWFNIKLIISTHDHNVNACKSFDVCNHSNIFKCCYAGLMN